MQVLLTISFIFLTFSSFAQQNEKDTIYNFITPFRPITVKIFNDTGCLASNTVNNNSKISYQHIKPGSYKIQFSGLGKPLTFVDSIFVGFGQSLLINFKVDGPCIFDHPKNYIPICPKNHKNKIIPIVYGLVASNGNAFIKNKKDIKVKYGGCVVSSCDPMFYCKIHNIEF